MNITRTVSKFAAIFLLLATAYGGENYNIVQNADFSVSGKQTTNWQFIKYKKDQHQATIKGDFKNNAAVISINGWSHSWWQQEVPVKPGFQYAISCKIQVLLKSLENDADGYSCGLGVAFLDSKGKLIKFEKLLNAAKLDNRYPSVKKIIPNGKWKDYAEKFQVPQGCVEVRIRLDCDIFGADIKTSFKDLKMVESQQAVGQVLQALPDQLPQYDIELGAVSSHGITLTPDWNLQDAWRQQSLTREDICLNGLWAIQPAHIGTLPTVDDWAFIKVPGIVRKTAYKKSGCRHEYGTGVSFIYGMDKASWKDINNQANTPPGVWYVRNIEIPKSNVNNKRIEILFTYLSSFSVQAYWNGKKVGTLLNKYQQKLDLTDVATPGKTGQLALYCVSSRRERKYAPAIASGQMERCYDPFGIKKSSRDEFDTAWASGFSDVFLKLYPRKDVFDRVKVITSFRNKQLSLKIYPGIENAKDYKYTLTVSSVKDGAQVFEDASPTEIKENSGKLLLSYDWTNPTLWSPNNPYLYSFQLTAKDAAGNIVDQTIPERFGFREIYVDGRNLIMNGKLLRLRTRMLYDHDARTYEQLKTAFIAAKKEGYNCLLRAPGLHELEARFPIKNWYKLGDEVGLMMMPYAPHDGIFSYLDPVAATGPYDTPTPSANAKQKLDYIDRNLIAPLENHPCIVSWNHFAETPSYKIDGNQIHYHPERWGIYPLNKEANLKYYLTEERRTVPKQDLQRFKNAKMYDRLLNELDPTRPVFNHVGVGTGNGMMNFAYLNWTPVQEWEDWFEAWSKKGVMPVGVSEMGLPYYASWYNHSAGSNGEPWITEYAATILGADAYRMEREEYLDFLHYCMGQKSGSMSNNKGYNRYKSIIGEPAYQQVIAYLAQRVLRTWRTYGMPLGVEIFGSGFSAKPALLTAPRDRVIADPKSNLKEPKNHLDKWQQAPSHGPMLVPILKEDSLKSDTPTYLNDFGRKIKQNYSDLLVYIAGYPKVSAKDHNYRSGETVEKQIAVIWDAHQKLSLELKWNCVIDGKQVANGTSSLKLDGGEIRLKKISFKLPQYQHPVTGFIYLNASDTANTQPIQRDTFQITVYPEKANTPQLENTLVFDPEGSTVDMLNKLGYQGFKVASSLNDFRKMLAGKKDCLVIIGRNALQGVIAQKLVGLDKNNVLLMEQDHSVMETMGFHAYPMRRRLVYEFPGKNAITDGLPADGFQHWRVDPKLLPNSFEPLKKGHNWHAGYYGAVASVELETPSRGNFTPFLQCGFDLAMSPLIELRLPANRWMFCQLSLLEGAKEEPVAQISLANALKYMATKPAPLRPLKVLGDKSDLELASVLGAQVDALTTPAQVGAGDIVLIGKSFKQLDAINPNAVKIILPRPTDEYQGIKANATKLSFLEDPNLQSLPALSGIGLNNLHFREKLKVVQFDGNHLIASKGNSYFAGFNPMDLHTKKKQWLRLTYRNQCRALSQLLTNLNVDLPLPTNCILDIARNGSSIIELDAKGRYGKLLNLGDNPIPEGWNEVGFDDSSWLDVPLSVTYKPESWRVLLRITFASPKNLPPNLLMNLGTFDDKDKTYLNGKFIGSMLEWTDRRIYRIPDGSLKPGEKNTIAIEVWNHKKSNNAWIRRSKKIYPASLQSIYAGNYNEMDDPYIQRHW